MTRRLRPVPDSLEENEAVYVVAQTQHVLPGTPFVIARCVDRGVAVVFALAGQKVRTQGEMLRESATAEALAAWEAGDDSLFRMERKARAAFGRPDRKEMLHEVRWHPSRIGNIQT